MSGPSVYLTWPNGFKLFPSPLPQVLPPPVKERTFRAPFGIDKDLFNFALEPWLPMTFAAVYIVTVFSLNAYNRRRNHKPWWLARQRPFQWFVVVHNVLLAMFSAATFLAMVRAIIHTWPEIRGNPHAAASVADALCKINGPRGLGDAATFNTTINIWEVKNTAIHLGYDGNPDPTDVGRLWNEGLAFWGWVFYVSKFYEVIDTLIILAKGKRSATLQTYHHAGAMLCMWAGIRYMSPPIWMFVFINSAIHAMMYTYFTASALGYRVPQGLKRALTSLQIAQFVFGASYAAAHLFVAYDIPVQTPYQVMSVVERAASSVSSAAVAATSTVSSIVASPTPRDTGAFIKKLLLRAAGEEGLAERVRDRNHHLIPEKLEEKIEQFNEQTFETRWRTDWTKVNCIDTSGEAFAIYLNLLYLAPLTGLFLRFFYKAYNQRGKARRASQMPKQIADSSKQADEETEQYIERRGEQVEDEIANRAPEVGDKIRQEANDLTEQLRNDVEQMKQGKFKGSRRVSDRVASFEGKAKNQFEKGKEQVANAVEKAKDMANGSSHGSPRQSRSGSPRKEEGSGTPKQEDRIGSPVKKDQSGSPKKEEGSGSPRKAERNRSPQKSDRSRIPQRSGSPQKKQSSSPIKEEDESKQQQRTPEQKSGDDEMRPKRQADEATRQPEEPKKSQAEGKGEDAKALTPHGKDRSVSPSKRAPRKLESRSKSSQGKSAADDKEDSAAKPAEESTGKDAGPGASQGSSQHDTNDHAGGDDEKPENGNGANESEEKQDANMADSQALRPGAADGPQFLPDDNETGKSGEDDNSDAMGQSGSIIDMTKEKANDARKDAEDGENKDREDPTEGAQPSGHGSDLGT